MVKFAFESYPSASARNGAFLAFLFSLAGFFLIAGFWGKLPPQIPLFYCRPWGEEILAPPSFLFLLPFSSLLVLIVNLFLAKAFSQSRLLSIILIFSATLFSFLALFNILKIITLIA